MQDVRTQIRSMLAKQLGISEGDIADDADLLDVLGADSLDSVELITAIEDRFSITVSDEDAMLWRTVDAMASYLTEQGVGK